MKLNPDAPSPADMIRLMLSSEHLPDRVGGGACNDFRPDRNGECLNCDEWADAHSIIAGGTRETAELEHILRLCDAWRREKTQSESVKRRYLAIISEAAREGLGR